MTAAVYDFYYATSEADAARAGRRTAISREANLRLSERRMSTLTHPAPFPPEWAQDLWDVIIGAYLADRLAPRKKADDRWTRHISLALPVTDLSRWTDECRTLLSDLLQTATGDRWQLEFRQWRRTRPIDDTDLYQDDATTHADQVALFSGGLDSTAHAATAARKGVNAILVSFSLQKLAAFQSDVYSDIKRLSSGSRLRIVDKLPMEVTPPQGQETADPGAVFPVSWTAVHCYRGLSRRRLPRAARRRPRERATSDQSTVECGPDGLLLNPFRAPLGP